MAALDATAKRDAPSVLSKVLSVSPDIVFDSLNPDQARVSKGIGNLAFRSVSEGWTGYCVFSRGDDGTVSVILGGDMKSPDDNLLWQLEQFISSCREAGS